MVKELVGMNYATLVILACLLVFIFTNDYFSKKVRSLFLTAGMMVLCLVIVDSVEYYTASLSYFTPLRTLMSAIGYSLRPTIIYVVILLLGNARDRNINGLPGRFISMRLLLFPLFLRILRIPLRRTISFSVDQSGILHL